MVSAIKGIMFFQFHVAGIVLSMRPCLKWSQSRMSSLTSLFCRSEDVTKTEKMSATTFPECLSRFSGQSYPRQRMTLLQLLFWSNPKAPTSSWYIYIPSVHLFWDIPVFEATASCLLWLFLPWSAGVTINSDVSLNIFGTWSSVHTKCLIISDQHQRRWSYLYKGILFILFILKNYSVYLVLLLFVSIEILHVHASFNTFDFRREKFDTWIWSCVIFALIPFFWYNQCVGRPHKEYILFLFKYMSYFCCVKHCPSCINLDVIRLYLNKYCIKLYDTMCHLCCQYND